MSIPTTIQKPPAEIRWSPETLLWVSWQHKGWVALGLAIGLIASAAIGAIIPRSYQSTAQISIVKKTPDPLTGMTTRNLAAEENMSPPLDLLKSSLIVDRAIHSKGLGALDIEVPEGQDLSEHIRNTLTVAAGKGPNGPNHVFKLQFRTRNPEDCRTVLSALLDTYKEFMEKKHQTVSEDTIETIMREKPTLQKEREQLDAAYRAFRAKAPGIAKSPSGSELRQEQMKLLMQKVDLEGQLASLDAAIKEGRSPEVLLALLADFMRKGNAIDGGRDRQANVQDQLFPLLMEQRKLTQIHGPNHPAIKEISERVEMARRLMVLPPAAWQCDLDKKTNVDPVPLYVQLLKQRLHHIQASEGVLAVAFQAEQEEASRLSVYELQNESFRTRVNVNQQLYEGLVKRLNDLSLLRNVGGHQIEMLESPSIGKRVAPSMTIALAVGAMLGLILGVVIACRVEARNPE
ncbi:MAG: hypothetical protein HYR84_07870 [Planctomycetes bacterium]|nr:hypothetical protein [Planctomycetota bacterium]